MRKVKANRKVEMVIVRVPGWLKFQVQRRAEAEGRSISGYLRILIEEVCGRDQVEAAAWLAEEAKRVPAGVERSKEMVLEPVVVVEGEENPLGPVVEIAQVTSEKPGCVHVMAFAGRKGYLRCTECGFEQGCPHKGAKTWDMGLGENLCQVCGQATGEGA